MPRRESPHTEVKFFEERANEADRAGNVSGENGTTTRLAFNALSEGDRSFIDLAINNAGHDTEVLDRLDEEHGFEADAAEKLLALMSELPSASPERRKEMSKEVAKILR